jgi:predicted HTH transcriptional regulator
MNPQAFLPNAEVRCMHFHGTEIARPVPFYRIFKGNLFEQVDQSVDFVLSKLNRSVGTRSAGSQAPVEFELPKDVVVEAIVNAVAHRDYGSGAAVQVLVFADRVEVWNPGELPSPLTPERLRHPHSSILRNHRIAEALFLAHYIEKFGTGTLMMIRETATSGLPEPDFAQCGGEFTTTVWRDWVTDEVVNRLQLNERQRQVILHVKQHGRIANAEFQTMFAVAKRTASMDLGGLVAAGLLERFGFTGKGVYYRLAKGAMKGQKGQGHDNSKGQQTGNRGVAAGRGTDRATIRRAKPARVTGPDKTG